MPGFIHPPEGKPAFLHSLHPVPTKGVLNTRQALCVQKDVLALKKCSLSSLGLQDLPHGRPDLKAPVALRGLEIRLFPVPHPAQLNVMEEVNNYNTSYARVLVMKSSDEMMRNPGNSKTNNPESSKKRLYSEIKKGGEEIEFYSQRYKEDMKELMKQVVFFRTLLEREATSEYLSQNYPQMVKEVQKILTRSETEVLS